VFPGWFGTSALISCSGVGNCFCFDERFLVPREAPSPSTSSQIRGGRGRLARIIGWGVGAVCSRMGNCVFFDKRFPLLALGKKHVVFVCGGDWETMVFSDKRFLAVEFVHTLFFPWLFLRSLEACPPLELRSPCGPREPFQLPWEPYTMAPASLPAP
jgi:hypothetical protein